MGVELQHLFLEVVYFKTLGVLSPETQIVVFWGFQLCSEPDSNNTCFEGKISFWNSKKPSWNLFWRTTLEEVEEQHLFWNSQFSCASCLCHPELFSLLWLAKATPIVHDILLNSIYIYIYISSIMCVPSRSPFNIASYVVWECMAPWASATMDQCPFGPLFCSRVCQRRSHAATSIRTTGP